MDEVKGGVLKDLLSVFLGLAAGFMWAGVIYYFLNKVFPASNRFGELVILLCGLTILMLSMKVWWTHPFPCIRRYGIMLYSLYSFLAYPEALIRALMFGPALLITHQQRFKRWLNPYIMSRYKAELMW